MALVVTGGGGLLLMAGMLLLGQAAGSYELTEILQRGDVVKASPLYVPILLLVLGAAPSPSRRSFRSTSGCRTPWRRRRRSRPICTPPPW